MKGLKVVRNIVGSVGMVFLGYVIASSLTDLRRYIKISTM